MVTFAVQNAHEDTSLQNKEFSDMYELLAYVSSYVHDRVQEQNKLADKLENIKQEDGDGPFTVDEAKDFLSSM